MREVLRYRWEGREYEIRLPLSFGETEYGEKLTKQKSDDWSRMTAARVGYFLGIWAADRRALPWKAMTDLSVDDFEDIDDEPDDEPDVGDDEADPNLADDADTAIGAEGQDAKEEDAAPPAPAGRTPATSSRSSGRVTTSRSRSTATSRRGRSTT